MPTDEMMGSETAGSGTQPQTTDREMYQGRPNGRANIAEGERLPSIVIGSCLAAFALFRRTPGAIALGALGAGMIFRGMTSYCPFNAALGINHAPSDHNPDATIM